MKGYGTRQVAQILGLSPSQVRGYVRAGFLDPSRGSRGEFQFSFPDLVFLRTARGLREARIPDRRVLRALADLRRELPAGRSLTGLRIRAEGSRIVVADGQSRWQPGSGQTLFDFDASDLEAGLPPFLPEAVRAGRDEEEQAGAWYELGCELEAGAPEEARNAYERALELDPGHPEAHLNLGRMLHEAGDPAAGERHYRRALEAKPADAVAAFNLGVALEDLGRDGEALDAYEVAIELDPEDADAHFNAANLCERLREPASAVGHWKSYRSLTRGRPG